MLPSRSVPHLAASGAPPICIGVSVARPCHDRPRPTGGTHEGNGYRSRCSRLSRGAVHSLVGFHRNSRRYTPRSTAGQGIEDHGDNDHQDGCGERHLPTNRTVVSVTLRLPGSPPFFGVRRLRQCGRDRRRSSNGRDFYSQTTLTETQQTVNVESSWTSRFSTCLGVGRHAFHVRQIRPGATVPGCSPVERSPTWSTQPTLMRRTLHRMQRTWT